MAGPKTKIRTTPDSDNLDNIVGWCAHTILASNEFPELIHYSKYKHPNTLLNCRGKNKDINMSKNTGFQPDGGTFCFKETPMKPEICYEAKFQGKGGQAGPDLAYKNILILLNPKCGLNPKGKMVIIASGPGADANPEGITKAEKGKFQCFKDLVYQMFGDSVEVYQKVDEWKEQEVMDIMMAGLCKLVGRPYKTIPAPIVKSLGSKKGMSNFYDLKDVSTND